MFRMFDGLQILSNTTKQHETRWPNGKMFGHQTFPVLSGLYFTFQAHFSSFFTKIAKILNFVTLQQCDTTINSLVMNKTKDQKQDNIAF